MTQPLPAIQPPVETSAIRSGDSRFRCEPYACILTARSCVTRQEMVRHEPNRTDLYKCKGCKQGEEVARRSGVVVDGLAAQAAERKRPGSGWRTQGSRGAGRPPASLADAPTKSGTGRRNPEVVDGFPDSVQLDGAASMRRIDGDRQASTPIPAEAPALSSKSSAAAPPPEPVAKGEAIASNEAAKSEDPQRAPLTEGACSNIFQREGPLKPAVIAGQSADWRTESTQNIPKNIPAGPASASKNPDALALGRLGGAKGGPARAAALPAEERSRISSQAAKARWGGGPRGPEGATPAAAAARLRERLGDGEAIAHHRAPPPERRRNAILGAQVTREEHERVSRAAARAGSSISDLVRAAVLGSVGAVSPVAAAIPAKYARLALAELAEAHDLVEAIGWDRAREIAAGGSP